MNPLPLPVSLRAYRYGLYLGEPAVAGLLAWRSRRGKEDPRRLPERRGRPGRARPPGRLVWMHGASIGEALSLIGLVEGAIARGVSVLVTTGTRSAAELLETRLPEGAFHQYVPLDAPRWVERFLAHWQPDLALVAESELWPNTVISLHARGIPLILVNGRMSERSARGWGRSPRTAAALLSRIAVCLAQTREDAARFARLGAPRIAVTGNLKYDAPDQPADPLHLDRLTGLLGDRPVWVAASTHPGEEAMVLAAHATLKARLPRLLTLVVPRHPHRGEAIAAEAAAFGLRANRRAGGGHPIPAIEVHVADTLGELGLFYRLSPLALLGGSLVPHGGQNPIEPARLGCALLHGPHVGNFSETYAALDEAGGARSVADAAALADTLGALFADPVALASMAEKAREGLRGFEGATARTLALIEPFIAQIKPAAGRAS